MEEAEIDDPSHTHLKLGALQEFEEIHDLAQHLKDELDEVKRNEVERIRKLLKAENKLQAGKKVNFETLINDVGGHMDTANPKASFGMNDLKHQSNLYQTFKSKLSFLKNQIDFLLWLS